MVVVTPRWLHQGYRGDRRDWVASAGFARGAPNLTNQVATQAHPRTSPIQEGQHRPIITPTRTDSGSGPSVVAQISPITATGGDYGRGRLCGRPRARRRHPRRDKAEMTDRGLGQRPEESPGAGYAGPRGDRTIGSLLPSCGGLDPDRAFSVPHTAESARQTSATTTSARERQHPQSGGEPSTAAAPPRDRAACSGACCPNSRGALEETTINQHPPTTAVGILGTRSLPRLPGEVQRTSAEQPPATLGATGAFDAVLAPRGRGIHQKSYRR